MLFQNCDNLSKTLQSSTISSAESQDIVKLGLTTLRKTRTDESFELFWTKVTNDAVDEEVGQPCLPRKRKAPTRFEALLRLCLGLFISKRWISSQTA